MCATCGCGEEMHDHDQARRHRFVLRDPHPRTITLEERVLGRNDELAVVNRRRLADLGIVAINLLSSPGAGKTTLLERTLRDLGGERRFAVIEGDQATDLDAQRIRATGCATVQINTGTGCHLDAAMVSRALDDLDPAAGTMVLVENVGNLVCPALFDLGEAAKVVVASVTEGEDKPLKYPHVFRAADLVLLNKTDLLPHLSFDVQAFHEHVREVAPRVGVQLISARLGDGLDHWYGWLRSRTAHG